LDIAGLPLEPDQHLDGRSLKRLLEGSTADALPPRALYWHYPHYSNQGGFPSGAIRLGDGKFIERYEDGSGQLFNLAADIGVQKNLVEERLDRASALRKQLHEWYKTVDARFLQPRDGTQPWAPGD